MIKKLIIASIATLLLTTSCSIQKEALVGRYVSTCVLHNEPNLTMELNGNGGFIYDLALLEDTIYGSWKINRDTLVLSSKYFTNEYKAIKFPEIPIELTPSYKFTDRNDIDLYLVKRRKLYPINKDGQLKKCVLIKK